MRECRSRSSSLCLSMGIFRKAPSISTTDSKRMAYKRVQVMHYNTPAPQQSTLIIRKLSIQYPIFFMILASSATLFLPFNSLPSMQVWLNAKNFKKAQWWYDLNSLFFGHVLHGIPNMRKLKGFVLCVRTAMRSRWQPKGTGNCLKSSSTIFRRSSILHLRLYEQVMRNMKILCHHPFGKNLCWDLWHRSIPVGSCSDIHYR